MKKAGAGLRNFVVVGTDTSTFATGPYWSGSEQFPFVVPEPSSWLLVILGITIEGLKSGRRILL
ncbi:MAG TPA: hypothetical protein DHW22_03130 [Planctomycetaceae bacterium]|nr:hypothetical protein [Planctomycetaceae bacterium]